MREAIPPTDFDAPYSKMPPSVEKLMPRVKQKVIESYKPKVNFKMIEERKANAEKRSLNKTIKKNKDLKDLALIKQSRLSVMPIDTKSWKIILKMGKIK